ncbi:hypothetical protein A7X67_07425 [Clostridium sp. W14A]|nr:hypothetical protein A7X67_07425 [Clostridium sp. W14A]
MEVFKNITDSVTKAVNFVVDKNRRAAIINRLKIVIRNEKEIEARSYIELGKYYYENMRDASNERTEPLCVAVDNSDRRLKRAFMKLDEMMVPAGVDDEEEVCGDECACAECASDDGDDFFRTFSAAEGEPDGTDEAATDDPIL